MIEKSCSIPDIVPSDPNDDTGSPERVSQVLSFAIAGVEARQVVVEVAVRGGYPRTSILGRPDSSVRETPERVETAIKSTGLPFPDRKVVINIFPGEIQKEGPTYDLPVALAILAEMGRVSRETLADWAIVGELSLDGQVRAVRGTLAMAIELERMPLSGSGHERRRFLVPIDNAVEAASVTGIDVIPVKHLREAVAAVDGRPPVHPMPKPGGESAKTGSPIDLSDLRGQEEARRALEIAIAGGHNIFLIGPPGGGKTLLAQRAATILPPMTHRESVETTLVHSIAGMVLSGCGLVTTRPFRAPHHSITTAGLIGGGGSSQGGGKTAIYPGEASLAHNGVLFLDEMHQFHPAALDSLRQPLESGTITVTRGKCRTATFPARFTLIGASNPCKCGNLGDSRKACTCTPSTIQQHRSRLSGPLMDRLDMHVEVPRVSIRALSSSRRGECSASVRDRVIAAREIQARRFADERGIHANAQMTVGMIEAYAGLDPGGKAAMRTAADRLGFSGRAYHRILRVARTIADLEMADAVGERHVAKAIAYRVLDRTTSIV
jgi:magnesium chelatase family protein